MSSSAPIMGRIGEMIIVWLADEKTSSQSVKTITSGDLGSDVEPFDAEALDISAGGTAVVVEPGEPTLKPCSSPLSMDERGRALGGRHHHHVEDVHVLRQVGD